MLNIKTLPQNVLSAVHVQPVLKYLPTSNPSERFVFAFNAKSFVIIFLVFFPSGLVLQKKKREEVQDKKLVATPC